jgi:hypothetical protein
LDDTARRRRYELRLLLWLLLLALVLLYAWQRLRHLRSDWTEPTPVALVVVDGSTEGLLPSALETLRDRVPALEERLAQEFQRYRPEADRPFHLSVFGPVAPDVSAPRAVPQGLWGLIVYNLELWRFSRRCDELAGVDRSAFPVRVYLRARTPRSASRQAVEGASQQNGPIGLVEVELTEASVDFALFVAAHELFHTRGASDKYGPDGLALFPDGFADPTQAPLFPQRGAEVMARGRPVTAHEEEPPGHLDELVVGLITAVEVGWTSPP